MKVCIARNTEARTNAGIMRIMEALSGEGHTLCLLTRSRYCGNLLGRTGTSTFSFGGISAENHEIRLAGEVAAGLRNVTRLALFQLAALRWFIAGRRKYDAVHAFDLDTGLPALIAARLLRKRLVYHIADFYADSRHGIPATLKKLIKRLEYIVISNADATVICTESRAAQIKGSRPKRLAVVHNSPAGNLTAGPETPRRGAPGELVACYVGELTERRFVRHAINAVKDVPGLRLVIAGIGPLEGLAERAAAEHHNIEYLGKLSYTDALAVYAGCDVMFAVYDPGVANHRFSAPNKVYEAMMLGKPIIVARGTGVDEMVSGTGSGIEIEYSEESFREALFLLRDNPEKAAEMSGKARAAFSGYSWETMRGRVTGIYRGLGESPEGIRAARARISLES